jgi:5'(3')-deoxyribonucleotidase
MQWLFYCNDDVKKTLPLPGNKALTATAKESKTERKLRICKTQFVCEEFCDNIVHNFTSGYGNFTHILWLQMDKILSAKDTEEHDQFSFQFISNAHPVLCTAAGFIKKNSSAQYQKNIVLPYC